MGYLPKVHGDGPDSQVVEDGGTIVAKSGAIVELQDGASLKVGDTTYEATVLEALLAVIADLPTENVASPGIWNNAGVLTLGSA